MATWSDFVEQERSLAKLAEERLKDRVAYLATVRQDGSPRVHPVTARIDAGKLFIRMYPDSPKVSDLRKEPRLALHSQVDDVSGSGGEIFVSGTAAIVEDRDWINNALEGLPDPDPARYVVFELDVAEVKVTLYEGERTVRKRWRAAKSSS